MNFNVNQQDLSAPLCRPNVTANATMYQDYLHIPGGVYNNTTPREFYCDSNFNTSVISKYSKNQPKCLIKDINSCF